MSADTKPLRIVQPVVVPAQVWAIAPLASAFVAYFPAMFVFVVSNVIHGGFDPVTGYAVATFVVAFLIAMTLFAIKFFYEPSHTSYAVYTDRVEYTEGLFNRQQRTVFFDHVIDVQLTEGLLQRMQGAGTVRLVTQQLVSSGEGKLSNRRIDLSNVPKPQEIYELLREIAFAK